MQFRELTPSGLVPLLLEKLDGTRHHTGMRRFGGVGIAHAAARFIATDGSVWAPRQVINDGGPTLVPDLVGS